MLMTLKNVQLEGANGKAVFAPKDGSIALTANAFDSDRENALAAGCNHFMTKPVKKRELMDLLFRYFKQQPQ